MIDCLLEALALPPSARMERRVPKAMLAEHGAISVGDRKLVESGIERLRWRASLKPGTIGIPAFNDNARDYSEIAVLTLEVRDGANISRLAKIAHTAIPYPLILIIGDGDASALSVAPKRRHERQVDRFVIDRLMISPTLTKPLNAAANAYVVSLDVAGLPATNLWSLYEGLVDRIEAYAAAGITGAFRLLLSAEDAAGRRVALDAHNGQAREIARLRRAAAAEKRLAVRIDLSHAITRAEAELRRLTQLLA